MQSSNETYVISSCCLHIFTVLLKQIYKTGGTIFTMEFFQEVYNFVYVEKSGFMDPLICHHKNIF